MPAASSRRAKPEPLRTTKLSRPDAFDLPQNAALLIAPPAAAPAIGGGQKQVTLAAPAHPAADCRPAAIDLASWPPSSGAGSFRQHHVMLGLPHWIYRRARRSSIRRRGDAASQAADIASSLVTEFRRHLKTACETALSG